MLAQTRNVSRYPQFIRPLFCLVTLLFLAGCPLESSAPLSAPSGAKIDGKLLGRWQHEDKATKEVGFLTISQFNENEMLIVMEEEGKKSPDTMRAFVTDINGRKFLNVQEIQGKYGERKWMFVSYTAGDCSLTFRIVNDSLVPEGGKKELNSTQIYELIKKNLADEKAFDKPTPLTCVRN